MGPEGIDLFSSHELLLHRLMNPEGIEKVATHAATVLALIFRFQRSDLWRVRAYEAIASPNAHGEGGTEPIGPSEPTLFFDVSDAPETTKAGSPFGPGLSILPHITDIGAAGDLSFRRGKTIERG